MDLTKIRLVVSDMDGTLLNNNAEISPGLYDILHRMEKEGILFAVASGRQYYSLLERLERAKNEVIFIAENGALTMHKGEQKDIIPMGKTMVLRVIKEVRALGGKYLILSGKKKAYIEKTDPDFMKEFLKHYEKYEVVEDLTKLKDEAFLKLTVCDLSGAENGTYASLKHFQNELQVKLSGKIWVDFTDMLATKGNALKKIQEFYGISRQETMAFGDYMNDLDLFELSEYSYAMENAHEEVKEAAKYNTSSNDDRGVEKVLEDLLKKLEPRV